MRPGFGQFNVATPEYLQFAAQFGATDVLLNTPLLPGSARWELFDLVKLRLSVEQWGLKLTALENVPTAFYDHIMLNGPRRDEQIENMIYTIRNIARAGIPIFGYNWMPSHVWRTPPKQIRGGAFATAYDHRLGAQLPLTHDREYSEEEMWANLEYWIKIITPIAEEEGIRLGIHPCDPPVDVLGGVPQLLRSFQAYKRLIEIYPSDANAIEFCQGTFSEMDDGSRHLRQDPLLRLAQQDPVRPLPQRLRPRADLPRRVRQHRLRRHVQSDADVPRGRLRQLLHRRPRTANVPGHGLGPPRPRLRQRLHSGADRGRKEAG